MLGTMIRRSRKKAPAVFRASSPSTNQTSSLGNIQLVIPLAIQVGDLMIAVITSYPVATITSAPAGWVQKADIVDPSYGVHSYVYTKVCVAGDRNTVVQWNYSTSTSATGVIFSYSGSSGIDVVGGQMSASSPWIAPSINTTKSNKTIVVVWLNALAAYTLGTDASTTVRFNFNGSASSIEIADYVKATIGATGTKSITTGGGAAASFAAYQMQI